MSVLTVTNLAKAFGGVRAVDGVSFSVEAGERVALIGPNGAGKTTLFNSINGQIRPDAGVVKIRGVETTGLAPNRVWRHGVGRTFQITATFVSMTVRENVQVALASYHRSAIGVGRALRHRFLEEAQTLIQQVGLGDAATRPVSELAYGDLKRLELAVALTNAPKLLLMDEPTAGMAGDGRSDMMDLVDRLVIDAGISVLFTEHDMDVVFGYADRVVVLDRGRIIASGEPDAVRADANVRAVYLGAYDDDDGGAT
ncbi:MAG: ABC transporter ATP-binding protein [Alphaproteobacteria bacterium]|jgi:branched-chain amino acid transport system ATP-binding protein|nr:ABC transporter ATP-binding protein [Alphaproteobacteria bacterium]